MQLEEKVLTKREAHKILDVIENDFEEYKLKDANYLDTIQTTGSFACEGKYYSFLESLKDSDEKINDLYNRFELSSVCQKCMNTWSVNK